VRLTNVDRFESVNLEFRPEQFIEPRSRTWSAFDARRVQRFPAPGATAGVGAPARPRRSTSRPSTGSRRPSANGSIPSQEAGAEVGSLTLLSSASRIHTGRQISTPSALTSRLHRAGSARSRAAPGCGFSHASHKCRSRRRTTAVVKSL